MLVGSSVVVPAGPEVLWRALLRWEDQARWMRDADSVQVLSGHREGVGVRLAVRTRVFGVPLFTEELEVTSWDPPHRLVIAHRSIVRGVGTWTLAPEGPGTRLGWTEEVTLPVPVLGEAMLLAYRPFLRRLMRGSLANLRAFASTPGR
jgi:uncharacterized protein YndB with AHSA1/START domain